MLNMVFSKKDPFTTVQVGLQKLWHPEKFKPTLWFHEFYNQSITNRWAYISDFCPLAARLVQELPQLPGFCSRVLNGLKNLLLQVGSEEAGKH